MDQPAEPRRRRLLIAVTAAGVVLLVAIGVGIYGLVRGPGTDTATPLVPSSTAATGSPSPGRSPAVPATIPVTGEPEAFARAVATALFTWDTLTDATPADYAQVLADVGDDAEADALASDVRAYLPTDDAWAQLKTYQTRQWLTIDTATVPQAWATAEAQDTSGQLPDGATAYTITGTRHRAGIWGTEPVEATRPVSFTVFIACAPQAPEFSTSLCRLLRLSELDNPLR